MTTEKIDIKELEQQYLEAEKTYRTLREQFTQAKKEEEEAKKKRLEAEKQKRYDAVIDAYKRFEELRSKFINDYGKFDFHAECKDRDMCEWIFKTFGLIQ